MQIDFSLCFGLMQAFVAGDTNSGIQSLQELGTELTSLDPSVQDPRFDPRLPASARFYCAAALWLHQGLPASAGIRDFAHSLDVHKHFPLREWAGRSVEDCGHLHFAAGLEKYRDDRFSAAAEHFGWVISVGELLTRHSALLQLCQLYVARCCRRRHEFTEGLRQIEKLRDTPPYLSAVADADRAWMLFKRGSVADAQELLTKCRQKLSDFDVHLAMGNVESALGRIAMREGSYRESRAKFDRALEHYRKWNPKHRNVARVLTNRGFVAFLLTRPPQVGITMFASTRPLTLDPQEEKPQQDAEETKKTLQQAKKDLFDAESIYSDPETESPRGIGTVKLHRALLLLQERKYDEAITATEEGLSLASDRKDVALIARRLVVRSLVKSHKAASRPVTSQERADLAEQALADAENSIREAKTTGDERRVAVGYVAKTWALLAHPKPIEGEIRAAVEDARSCHKSGFRDYLEDELTKLHAVVLSGGAESIVVRLARGDIPEGDLSSILNQLEEDIVTSVYRKTGSIARTAASLGISRARARKTIRKVESEYKE